MRPYGFMPSGRFSVFMGQLRVILARSPAPVPFPAGFVSVTCQPTTETEVYMDIINLRDYYPFYTSKYRKNNFLVFIKKFFKNFFPHPDKCTHPFGICVKGKQELCLLPTGGEGGELLWSNPLFKMSRQSDISLILCASWH